MSASSLITGTTSLISVTSYTINDDLTINKDNQKSALLGTLISAGSTTTTTLTQSVSNKLTVEKIRMQYAKSYVESMSDEELELALNKLNLIEEKSIENDVKII